MRTRLFLLVGLAVLLALPPSGQTQFRTQGPRGGRANRDGGAGGGRGAPRGDPSQLFDWMAKGKEVIIRGDLDPNLQPMFDRLAASLGITNGQMTRQQFLESMQQRLADAGPRGRRGPAPGAAGGGGRGNPEAGGAESLFRRLDQNGDGLLNTDEMPEALRIERDKWDADKDGFIDVVEFKAYYQSRLRQAQAERSALPGVLIYRPSADQEDEPRPVVYRAGKLPRDMPAWFAQLDTDGDGQIGLYEWKHSGWPLREFEAMDRNGDGFLTIEEVMRTVVVAKPGAGDGLQVAGLPRGGGSVGDGMPAPGLQFRGPGRPGAPAGPGAATGARNQRGRDGVPGADGRRGRMGTGGRRSGGSPGMGGADAGRQKSGRDDGKKRERP